MSPSGRIWVHKHVPRLKYSLKMKRTSWLDNFGNNRKNQKPFVLSESALEFGHTSDLCLPENSFYSIEMTFWSIDLLPGPLVPFVSRNFGLSPDFTFRNDITCDSVVISTASLFSVEKWVILKCLILISRLIMNNHIWSWMISNQTELIGIQNSENFEFLPKFGNRTHSKTRKVYFRKNN